MKCAAVSVIMPISLCGDMMTLQKVFSLGFFFHLVTHIVTPDENIDTK